MQANANFFFEVGRGSDHHPQGRDEVLKEDQKRSRTSATGVGDLYIHRFIVGVGRESPRGKQRKTGRPTLFMVDPDLRIEI